MNGAATETIRPNERWVIERRLPRVPRALLVIWLVGMLLAAVGAARANAETFGIESFESALVDQAGASATQAGSRPYAMTTRFVFDHTVLEERSVESNGGGEPVPSELAAAASTPKEVEVNLPRGLAFDPSATVRCAEKQLDTGLCPRGSAVGVLTAYVSGFPYFAPAPIYNMVAPLGTPGQFAANVAGLGFVVHMNGRVRSGEDYGLSAEVTGILKTFTIYSIVATFWGDPSDPSHDPERGTCGGRFLYSKTVEGEETTCPLEAGDVSETALLTMPSSCSQQPLVTSSGVESWLSPEAPLGAISSAPPVTGCGKLQFEPTIEVSPEATGLAAPSGVQVDLKIAQDEAVSNLGDANLREAVVTLPEGMSVNPSAAGGREACSSAQIGLRADSSQTDAITIGRPVAERFLLEYEGQRTAGLPADASAAAVQEALEGLPGIGPGAVSVTAEAGGWEVAFTGGLAGRGVSPLSGEVTDSAFQRIAVVGTGGTYNLELAGASTSASATGDLTSGSATVTGLSVESGTFLAGEAISGAGIPAGTTITAVDLGTATLTLSADAKATATGTALTTSLPYYAEAKLMTEALEALPGIGTGNVEVTGGRASDPYTGARRPLTVAFVGALADHAVSTLTATSALTGAGAGVTVTGQPPGSAPLTVAVAEEGGKTRFSPEVFNPKTQEDEVTACPSSSKIGTAEVVTPLLEHPLPGAVYLAAQEQNPFHSLLAVYLVIHDPATGVIVKLAGEVSLGEQGQITTSFKENPQLPVEQVKLRLAGGQRAPLVTPARCGEATTTTVLTPWSAPEGEAAKPFSPFVFAESGGEPCPTPGFQPSFLAGTTSNQAGVSSAFTLALSRGDHEQYFHSMSVTLPPGLLATLSGVPRCGEAEANAGTCGESSRIGETSAAAGVGNEPVWVQGGRVYLTGPYDGDPFGLSIVVPAVAGPFNLGLQVVRAGIQIDPTTAQATVTTDPTGPHAIPSILQGIPLAIKDIDVTVNRPGFVLNPTSCEPMKVTGTIDAISAVNSSTGATATVSSPFEAVNCATLPYKPSFSAFTQAHTSKLDGASLNIRITAPAGQANTAKAKLTLPKQLPTRLTTLQQACLAAVFAANPAACPEGSVIGTATVKTPLLAATLSGPLYLVSHGGAQFPDAEIVLQGEGVKLILDGHTDIKHGITTSTFESVPDAPFSSFETTLPEGPHSAFGTNIPAKAKGSMCGQKLTLPVTFTGQNGAVFEQSTKIAVTGCPKPHKAKKARRAKRARRGKRARRAKRARARTR